MREPKEKLQRLVKEREQFLNYLERLNAQVQAGEINSKERNFLIELKTRGLPPHEYLMRLDAQILHTSRYDETRMKRIRHASLVAELFLFIAMFFYAFINPTLTGLLGYDGQQEYILSVDENYTNGTTEYFFNVIDVGNNTNNLTSVRITGKYTGQFTIKLVSEVDGIKTEYVVYEPPAPSDSGNMITGYAVKETKDTITINDTYDEINLTPEINVTPEIEETVNETVNDTITPEINETIAPEINETITPEINETTNETGLITDFIAPYTTITDECIDTCNIELFPNNLSIVVEVLDGEFYLNKIIFTQSVINQAPVQIKDIPDVYGVTEISLSEYFYDPEGKKLTYDFMSNPDVNYSLNGNNLTITPNSINLQNFYVYATDGENTVTSNTFKVYSQTQIPQDILDALAQDSSVRIIVKTKTNSVLLTSGKGNKNLRTTGLEDVGVDYSRMIGKKVLVTDENVPIEIKREVGDLKSVVVDYNLLNQLFEMPDVEEISLDSKYSPLTTDVLNITKIEDVKNSGYSGLGIKVCVLDTGLSSALGYASTGYNFVNNNIDYSDVNGHGTNVIYPLMMSASGINLIVAKVIDDSGLGYASDIIAGLEYCAVQNASIISMSIGGGSSTGYCDDDLVAQKINELTDAGVLIVVATGNGGTTDSVKIPSCASGALPIGASTKSSSVASFSNYNNATLLVAPGQDIITKDISGNDISISGTSISVPFVTGTAALLLENESTLTSLELKDLLVHTGDLIDYNGRQFAQINAWNALIKNYTNNLTAGELLSTNVTVENYTTLAGSDLVMSLVSVYTDTGGAGTIDGAQGLQIDAERNLAYISAYVDSALTVLNITNSLNVTYYGGIIDGSGAGSLDDTRFGKLDVINRYFYATAQVGDAFQIYDVSSATPSLIGGIDSNISQNPYSLDGIYSISYIDIGADRFVAAGAALDDTISIYNVTDPAAPVGLYNYTATANPCSADDVRQLMFIPGTTYLVALAYQSDTLSIFNISADGSLSCVTNYTNAGYPGSLDNANYFYYENSTGLFYVVTYIDDDVSVFNLTDPTTIDLLDSVSINTFDAYSITVGTVGNDKFAFVGSTTNGQGIKIVNVTNPSDITYYGLFNETSGTCILNTVYDLLVSGDYLYITSLTDDCFYVIKLTKEANAPIFTRFNGSTTNFNKYDSNQLNNVSGAILEIRAYGHIDWNNPVNVSNANFDAHVDIGRGYIYVNSSGLHSSLNSSANITFYNAGRASLNILKDGVPCTTCTFVSYSGGNLTYMVTGFSNYSLTMNVTLISPSGITASPVSFISNIVDMDEIRNATLYTNDSGTFSPVETRWNGEVAYNSTGLVGLYHFNNESLFGENATCFRDFSSFGNNGSCSGTGCPLYNFSGMFGPAYKFDGTNDLITIPNSATFNESNVITISAWIYLNDNSSTDKYIVSKYDNWILAASDQWVSTPYAPYFSVYASHDLAENGAEYTSRLEKNTWYHIVGTYNGTQEFIYVNGVAGSTPSPKTGIYHSSDTVYVGAGPYGNGQWFNGTIDEVAVWTKYMNATEVAALYNYSRNTFYPVFQNRTLNPGTYVWNVLAYDNQSNYAWATSNYSFVIASAGLQCSNLTSANTVYTLSSNVSINGDTCFNVTAANVTIDCGSYWILGDNTTGTSGVYSNQFNTTVRGCNIKDFNVGIYFNGVNKGLLEYNNVTTSIADSGAPMYSTAILGSGTANTTVRYNNATSRDGIGSHSWSGGNNVFYNNHFESGGSSREGIRIFGINQTIINLTAISKGSVGIRISCPNSFFYNILAISNTSYGVDFSPLSTGSASNNTINNITGISDSSYGLYGSVRVLNNTITNSTFRSTTGTVAYFTENVSNNLFINNTFISDNGAATLLHIMPKSGNNKFIINNFTNTGGYYINDTNNTNMYNGTYNGLNQGNIYWNVINGTVSITGITESSIPGLYIGNTGTGYPYNSATSLNKVINATDYAPLTDNALPTITLLSPLNRLYSKPILFVSSITDNKEVINATLYTNESGSWTAKETRWNGEVAWNSTGLVALYHFNNESAFGENATKIYDWTGRGHTGTSAGTPLPVYYTTGKFGGSFNYTFGSTSESRFTIASSDDLQPIVNFTWIAWIYMINTTVDDYTIMTKGVNGIADNQTSLYVTKDDVPGSVIMRFGIYNGSTDWLYSNTNISDLIWHHVAVARAGTNVSFYLDGQSVGSSNLRSSGMFSNTASLLIGSDTSTSEGWNGFMDEISIWNRSLSAAEILALYDYSRTSFYPLFQNRTLNAGNITWNVLAYDNNSNSAWASNNFTFLFQPVWDVASSITPTIAYTDNILVGSCQGNTSDASTTLTYHYLWWRSNIANVSGSVSGITNGTLYNVHNISAANTTKGETWILSCRIEQFGGNSSWVNSTSVVILNSAPTVTSARISPTTAYTDDDLIGYCTATDTDADTLTYHYRWYKNDVINLTGSRTSIASGVEINVENITAENTSISDVWIIECKVDDLSVNGSAVNSSSVTILSESGVNVILQSPTNGATSITSPVFFVSSITDNQEVINASLYTNETGTWTAKETRWNGEVPWNITGLIALYHLNNESAFNENATAVYDFSGNGNNGTCSSGDCPVYTASGKFSSAYTFGGLDDKINVGNSSIFNSAELTITAWVKYTQTLNWLAVVTKDSGDLSYWFGIDDYNIDFIVHPTGAHSSYQDTSGTTTLVGDTWYHLAATYNGSQIRLYVNGILDNTPYTYTSGLYTSTSYVAIGESPYWSGNEFPGSIDEVSIWNRSLSAAEILALYNYSRTNFYPVFQNRTLSNGTYVWNVLAYDNISQSAWASSNYSFTIGAVSDPVPVVTLLNPANSASSINTSWFFVSNVSDNQEVINASLYTNESGSWVAKETRWNGEVAYNSTGLIALYHFNNETVFGDNATKAYDFSGNNRNLSIQNGARYQAAVFGHGLKLDGVNDFVNTSDTTDWTPGQFSVSLWFKLDKNATSTGVDSHIINLYNDSSSTYSYGLMQRLDDDYLYFYSSAGGWVFDNSNSALLTNVWYHVVFSVDASRDMYLYINSVRQTRVDSVPAFYPSVYKVVGSRSSGVDRLFNGTIDELSFWNKSLSSAEVLALYNYSRTSFYPIFQNRTLSNGTYVWNVLAYDNQSQDAWASANYSFTILPVSSCGNLATANTVYTLNNNVSINGATCFTVSAQNVTLNCSGYSITGDNTTATYGIYTTVFNTTVANCVVRNFQHGVYYSGANADNGTIINIDSTTTHDTGTGIYLYNGAQYNRIINSIGNSTSNNGIAAITNSNYNTIINSTGATASAYAGIRIDSSSNNYIDNCTGISSAGAGIFFVTDANYNTVRNSYAQTNTGNGAFDLYTRAMYNNITNCVGVVYSSGAGVYINLNTNYTIVNNFTGISRTGSGIYVYRNYNITIINSTARGRTGILLENATGVTISGSVMSSNSTRSALRLMIANNILVANSTMNASGTGVEAIEFWPGTSNTNNTFINNTLYSTEDIIYITPESGNNKFILNNFTATTGVYVNDLNGSNYYNGSFDSKNQGNIYWNVMNGTVIITGTVASSIPGLYIGTGGTGYPYNSTTSLGKIINATDYAPLTPQHDVPDTTPPNVTLTHPYNDTYSNIASQRLQSTITEDVELLNATLYTNESGTFTAKETRWNGEINYNDTDLQLLLHFNNESAFGDTSSMVYDFSGKGHSATIISEARILDDGMFGSAINFNDNNDDTVNVSDNAYFSSGQLTASLWFKLDMLSSTAGEDQILMYKDHSGTPWNSIYLHVNETDYLILVLTNSTGQWTGQINSDATIQTGQWYSVVFRLNSTYHGNMFINGVKDSTTLTLNSPLYDTDKYLSIGSQNIFGSYNINGSIDEVAIWNRSLSDAEIAALYDYSRTSFYPVFQNRTLNNGTYVWNVLAYDAAGNSDWSDNNYTLTINTINPSISFVVPTPDNGIKQSNTTNYAYINVSSSDDQGQHQVVVDFNRSLLAWWTFDNVSGTTVYDKSSYGHNASLVSNAYISEGYYGKGITPGAGYANVGTISEGLSNDTYTVELWFYSVLNDSSTRVFLSGIVNDYSTERIYLVQANNRRIQLIDDYGLSQITSSNAFALNTWYHLAYTYDYPSQETFVYLNGNLILSDTSFSQAPRTLTTVQIGGRGGSVTFSNGSLDEVKIYNRVLSPAEINASYNANLYKYYNNFTDLLGGNYSYTAYTTDRAGNTNQTSRYFTINSIPSVSNVILNATSANNYTTDNLTLYFVQSDADGDTVYNVTDWRKNGQSIAILNMPFNTNFTATSNATNGVIDYSVNANNAGLGNSTAGTQPIWISSGKIGGAYKFDGVNDFIRFTGPAPWNTLNNLTISFWLNHTNSSTLQYVFNKYVSTSDGWGMRFTGSDGNWLAVMDDIDNAGQTSVGAGALTPKVWHHIVVQMVQVNETHFEDRVYVDGSERGNRYNSSGSWASYAGTLYIGKDVTAYFLNGTIDELQIFNRSLSTEQITAIYQAGLNNKSLTTIMSQETQVGENWSTCVTASDGSDDSSTICSNNLTIQNAVPTIISSIIYPSTAYTNDTLRGYCNAADPDDVTLYYHFSWFLNGQINTSGTVGSFTQSVSSNVANISNSSLAVGQNWTLQCIADDIKSNSTAMNSSVKTIQERIPEKVTLKQPTNLNYTVHDRRPLFEWYTTNHTTQYQINITSSTGCGGDYYQNVTYPTLNFTPTNELCVDTEGPNTHYDWKVRACGDDGCGNWSDSWNFSIEPYVIITIVNNSVNLGSLALGETKNTTQGNPGPFVLQNDGNVQADLINASSDRSLWTSVGLGTIYYQTKSRASSEANSFNLTSSITTWTNVGSSNISLIRQLNYSDAADSAYVDVQVTVPGDEPPGAKQSSIIFSWEQSP